MTLIAVKNLKFKVESANRLCLCRYQCLEREGSRGYGMAFEISRKETEKLFKYSKNPHIHV